MIATALIIGFFSAVGWWGGNKTTAAIDAVITPPAVVACNMHTAKLEGVRHD